MIKICEETQLKPVNTYMNILLLIRGVVIIKNQSVYHEIVHIISDYVCNK